MQEVVRKKGGREKQIKQVHTLNDSVQQQQIFCIKNTHKIIFYFDIPFSRYEGEGKTVYFAIKVKFCSCCFVLI